MKRHIKIEIETDASGKYCDDNCSGAFVDCCTLDHRDVLTGNYKRIDECIKAEVHHDCYYTDGKGCQNIRIEAGPYKVMYNFP